MKKTINGFTIVELLVVIVVIAILASISVVAYTGVQKRARDSERLSEIKSIEKVLEIYRIDNGGYPNCSGGVYVPGSTGVACAVSSLTSALVPTYINKMPVDPINSGNDVYMYAAGYKRTGSNTFNADLSDNYITGMHLETQAGNVNSGWVGPAYYNYLGGSGN